MSICNTKAGASTLYLAYDGSGVITVAVCAYRSDTNVKLILPAGKPSLDAFHFLSTPVMKESSVSEPV